MDTEKEVLAFYKEMRDRALETFSKIDPKGEVDEKTWTLPIGTMEVKTIRGEVFEKVGISTAILDVMSPRNNKQTRVKVFEICSHMKNPKVPVGTISLRHLQSDEGQFMCHTDLSPIIPFEDDINMFKDEMTKLSERNGRNYEEMNEKLVNTFMSKYRKEPRGGGFGIAFEADNSGFSMMKDCGETFFRVFTQIVERRKDEKYSEEERENLLRKRARWVEFNLVEDEGFIIGLNLGMPPEPMIVQTLPPLVRF